MPETTVGIALLIIFVMPGTILTGILNRNILSRPTTDLRFVVQALIFSLLVHSSFSPWTSRIYSSWKDNKLLSDGGWSLAYWSLTALFAAPALIGFLASKLLEWDKAQPALAILGISWDDRTLLAWDWFAHRPEGAWLILEFKDGTRIGGKFDSKSRIALTPPAGVADAPRDIFLEELYEIRLDGSFGEKIPYNKGAWINAEDLRAIKIFRE